MRYKIQLLFSLIFIYSSFSFASIPDSTVSMFLPKKESKGPIGWEFSGNFGVYFANKYHASFYNGKSTNVNNINYVLSNYTWRNDIKNSLMTAVNVNRDSFMLSSLPSNMKYSSSMYVGFGARYNFNPKWAFNLEFNFVKLTAKDVFTLEVFPDLVDGNKYVQYPIWGIETRTNIQVGAIHTFNTEKLIRPFVEGGLIFTNTLVKESKISVEDQIYDLVNIYSAPYVQNTNQQVYEVRQGGLSFGGYANGGAKLVFNKFVSLELLASLYYNQINLEYYSAFKFHAAAMFRLVLSPGFFISKSE